MTDRELGTFTNNHSKMKYEMSSRDDMIPFFYTNTETLSILPTTKPDNTNLYND